MEQIQESPAATAGEARRPSSAQYSTARVASRVSADYVLRALYLLNELGEGELLTSIISLAIVQANIAHVEWVDPPARIDGARPPPDALRRPVSVLAIAQTLGLPYETTRRHVMKLIQSGACRRVGRGVVIPAEALDNDLNRAQLIKNLANLRRLFRDLRAAGVDLD